jgi:type IV pilus assembly protein PilB
MFEDQNSTIYDILSASAEISQPDLDTLYGPEFRENSKSFADEIVRAGLVTKGMLFRLIGNFLGFESIEGEVPEIDASVVGLLQADVARNYAVIPFRIVGTELHLLARDPFNFAIIDDLTFSLKMDVNLVVCDPEIVDALIEERYGADETTLADLLGEVATESYGDLDDAKEEDLSAAAADTPIIRFVNLVLQTAIKAEASDVHFEPFEDQFRIRYRVDGALYEMAPPPKNLSIPVISRIKVIADLNIAERRIPQDGRIKLTISGRPVDLRVSTLPTQFGESVVLRILDKSVVNLDLEALSLPEDIKLNVREAVRRPNGIFIVTGPTGSGKTTTLYSALREVNVMDTKILTAEDPVEYEIEGIMQVPVNHQVGLDFARALRAFLRQDPDKIMVGEIRDLETARIAVQASLTGHVVLSTLHTNDAAGAITRLLDMGLEPYLLAASLEFVLAQRLVRRICAACSQEYAPKKEMIAALNLKPEEFEGRQFYFGAGCDECNQTGYSGRSGLFEMIRITDVFRELITAGSATLVLKHKAVEQGTRPLREDGVRAIFDGRTTIEEILKFT